MPLSKYFSGKGEKVMSSMKEQYGKEKGERIFYATSNKRSDKGKSHKKKSPIDFGPSSKAKLGKGK